MREPQSMRQFLLAIAFALTCTAGVSTERLYCELFPVSTFETVWGFRLEEGFGGLGFLSALGRS
jgi:hypothetical protein